MNRITRQNYSFLLWRLRMWHYFRMAGKQSRQDIQRAKKIFLENFSVAFPVTEVPSRRMSFRKQFLLYGLASFLLFLVTSGGAIVFADQTNVSTTHPLYKLKRAGENIQLALSSPRKKTELESAFAQRRLNEIQDIQKDAVSENAARAALVAELNADFEERIDAALDKLDDASPASVPTARGAFCQNIKQAIERRAQIMPDRSDLPEDLSKVNAKCKKSFEK